MRIKITEVGTPPLVVVRDIQFRFIKLKQGIQVLGETARDKMRNIISTEKHRKKESQGNLESAINTYPSADGWSVGVGDLEELNYLAPYWYLCNYGGMSAIAARGGTIYGQFEGSPPQGRYAGTGVGRQYFYQNSFTAEGEMFHMKPKNPVWAMNYIEKTTSWLVTIWKVHFFNYTRSVGVFVP